MNPLSTRPNRWRPITVLNLLVGLLFSLSAVAQPAFLKEGLVAYYPFNGNANDASGNGKNGVVQGPVLTADRFGSPNSAYYFNGAGAPYHPDSQLQKPQRITSQLSQNFNNGFTFSAWVLPDSVQKSGANYIFGVGSNSNRRYGLSSGGEVGGQKVTTPGFRSIFAEYTSQSEYKVTPSVWGPNPQTEYNPANNQWMHIAYIASNNLKIYINGVEKDSQSVGGATGEAINSMVLGDFEDPISGRCWQGKMDDVRIYNRALSGADIKAIYDYESTPPNIAPTIVNHPSSQSLIAGSDDTFCVALKDAGTYNYQWQRNEQNIAGATLNCFSINSVTAAMDGSRYRVIVSNSAGTVISDTATLTVSTPPAPSIVTQPSPRTVQEGANVSLNVVATGQGSIVYQWQFNEQNLPGATSATLNLNGVKLNTAGRYRVLISSQYGVTISDTVTLTVNPNPPPTIVTQPLSRTSAEGTQVSLTVTATGLGNLTYQWQINNQNIPGATSSTLVLSAVRPSANGNYRVIVGNTYGTTISTEATVKVIVTDSDSDGLSDYEELLFGTNSNKADTDGDGLSDFAEVRTHGSNPLTTDTDGDGYSDGIEVTRDGNPNNRSVTPTGALAVFAAVDVEFYTLNGVKYQLEVSTDMVQWTVQGGVVVGNGGSQNHLVRASKATQFWRLKVVQ